MKKTIGNYTPDAGKVLKQSERVICCTGEDGMIYVTNGYLAYKFTPREYAAIGPARRLLRGRQLDHEQRPEDRASRPRSTWPRPSRTRSTRPPAWRRWSGAP